MIPDLLAQPPMTAVGRRLATIRSPGQTDVTIRYGCLSGIPIGPQRRLLSRQELERAQRYRSRRIAETFVKARGVLRTILAECTGARAAELVISDRDGRPTLPDYPQVNFSVSYSGNHFAVALANASIGLDVEAIGFDLEVEPIAQSFFHPDERASVAALSGHDRINAIYRIWTQKEAFVKALGCGLNMDLECFAVQPEGGRIRCDDSRSAGGAWFGTVYEPVAGYCLSLVCRSPSPSVKLGGLSDSRAGSAATTALSKFVTRSKV